jgi:hypothetical protein
VARAADDATLPLIFATDCPLLFATPAFGHYAMPLLSPFRFAFAADAISLIARPFCGARCEKKRRANAEREAHAPSGERSSMPAERKRPFSPCRHYFSRRFALIFHSPFHYFSAVSRFSLPRHCAIHDTLLISFAISAISPLRYCWP